MAIGGEEFVMDFSDEDNPCFRLDLFVSSPNPSSTELYCIKDVLVDTGLDCTFLPIGVVNSLKLIWTGRTRTLIQADGKSKIKIRIYPARIKVNGVVEEIFEIGATDSDPLIGMDLINKWHLLLNCPNGTFEIANKENYIPPIIPD